MDADSFSEIQAGRNLTQHSYPFLYFCVRVDSNHDRKVHEDMSGVRFSCRILVVMITDSGASNKLDTTKSNSLSYRMSNVLRIIFVPYNHTNGTRTFLRILPE
jgi:hypothetical protein